MLYCSHGGKKKKKEKAGYTMDFEMLK